MKIKSSLKGGKEEELVPKITFLQWQLHFYTGVKRQVNGRWFKIDTQMLLSILKVGI